MMRLGVAFRVIAATSIASSIVLGIVRMTLLSSGEGLVSSIFSWDLYLIGIVHAVLLAIALGNRRALSLASPSAPAMEASNR